MSRFSEKQIFSVVRGNSLVSGAVVSVLMGLLCACASIGNPSGGPRDEDPPVFIGSNPPQGATDVLPRRIVLDFNELVNVKDAFSKVVVSPSGSSVPRVSSSGRHVIINFTDSLVPETTYTVDFSNAIEDNNEGNRLEGFAYSFSTGPVLDSLRISGMVLGAKDLEPQQSIVVGAYPVEMGDSAFITQRLKYITKTDDRGRFILRGLKEGAYRLYALKDLDNDLKYANPEEDLAFFSQPIVPRAERIMTNDTIFDLHTGVVDTVVERMRTLFLPNDILLRSFNTGMKTQYLVKYERQDSTRLALIFNAKTDSVPALNIIGFPGAEKELVIEKSVGNDSLTYWLPKRLVKADSLRVAVRYFRADTTSKMIPVTDTLNFFVSRALIKERQKKAADLAKKSARDKEKKEDSENKDETNSQEEKTPVLDVKVNTSSDIFKGIELEFATPLQHLDTTAFHLNVKADTLWVPFREPYRIERCDTLNPRKWKITFKRDFSQSYQLEIDSLALCDIYGLCSGTVKRDMTTKAENDYSQLSFVLSGYPDSIPAYVDILNQSEGVVRSLPVDGGKVLFDYLDPGTFYARITLDYNGNGKFDTGDFMEQLQPDETFYFPGKISLKKNFDRQYEWNVFATAVDLQKPEKLKKNKPERRSGESSYDDEEDEDEIFDPTRNPFDPNDRGNNYNRNNGNRNSSRGNNRFNMTRPM